MKIISKFRDFYDSALAYGHDDSVIYRREQTYGVSLECEWPGSADALSFLDPYDWRWGSFVRGRVKRVVLLFCGKAYFYWLDCKTYTDLASPDALLNLMDQANLLRWLKNEGSDREFHYWIGDKKKFGANALALAETNGRSVDYGSFYAFNVASLLLSRFGSQAGISRIEVLTNPCLKSLKFAKHLDPYSTFQSIENFIGSVLGRADEAPDTTGSDRIIAQQKGFDKSSFRTTAPGAKKLNRRANRAKKQDSTSRDELSG